MKDVPYATDDSFVNKEQPCGLSSITMYPDVKVEVKDDEQGEDSSFEEGLCELPLQVVIHSNDDDNRDGVIGSSDLREKAQPSIVGISPHNTDNGGPLHEKIVCEEVIVKSASVTVKRHIRVTTQDRAAQTDFWPLLTAASYENDHSCSCLGSNDQITKFETSKPVNSPLTIKPSVTVNIVKLPVVSVDLVKVLDVVDSDNSEMSMGTYSAVRKSSEDSPQAPRKYQCHCGKAFTRSDHLKQHAATHSERKQYACNLCNKTFCRSDILNAHLRWHWGDTPYSCDVCGAVFVQASRLSRHRLIHLVHKPFPCEVCGMSFARADNLASHIRTHTGEKPFPCPDCGSAFRRADALQRHRRTHTGERPYGCSYCGRGFAAARALRIHERQHMAPEGDLLPGFPYPNSNKNSYDSEGENIKVKSYRESSSGLEGKEYVDSCADKKNLSNNSKNLGSSRNSISNMVFNANNGSGSNIVNDNIITTDHLSANTFSININSSKNYCNLKNVTNSTNNSKCDYKFQSQNTDSSVGSNQYQIMTNPEYSEHNLETNTHHTTGMPCYTSSQVHAVVASACFN